MPFRQQEALCYGRHMTEEEAVIARIFIPHMVRELARARGTNIRLAHYTSADTGLKI